MNVELKTTGYLYSELYTIQLKKKYAKSKAQYEEAALREHLLIKVIQDRTVRKLLNMTILTEICTQLYATLQACWNAQEIVMDSQDPSEVFYAAKETLRQNKRRNELIREIDALFGEQYFSYLEKTYNG